MKKQEAIQKAYGQLYNRLKFHIDELGWCTMFKEDKKLTPTFLELGFSPEYVNKEITSRYEGETYSHLWRPNILNGIETNSGWTKIESEADLPNKTGIYWVKFPNDIVPVYFEIGDTRFSQNGRDYYQGLPSHYQLAVKPQPPIY